MVEKPEKQEEMIFYQALEKEPADREAYLQEACGDNHELYNRIDVLLQAYDTDDSFHHVPPANSQVTLDSPPNLEGPGSIIGRYKLLEKIGEGGFGVVWAAAQKKPVKRRVALKIIKLGMDTKQVVARFEAERQALALMDHPNIAKVLDAGSTDTGRPYFVMELVRGIPVIEYCDQAKLSIQDRLNLFIKVCHAIQHAHQKGIIHRDIKPSNILITLHDGIPVPRIIDFGIAKATQQELTEMTIYTQHHQFIGTPAYMSPEQAEMSGLDIDTRSDIYSLGVLLYELLTGRTPFDAKELMQSGIDQMRRIIREQEPQKPSTKFATLQIQEQSTTATHHSTDSPRLISLLRGDLDWIVMKCLEKDRTRRYETANGLALDVVRHLNNEPVIARPPTAVYQLQKAWRRNKVVYTAVVAVVIALFLGTGISVWQAWIANVARQRAVQEEHKALRRAYNSDMSLAFRALEENLFGRVQNIVSQHVPEPGEPDFRGWEWRYAWAQSQSDAVHIWDTPEEMVEVAAVRISPDQRYLVSSEYFPQFWGGGQIRRLWSFEAREELKHVQLPSGSRRGVAFSNSGNYLVLHRGGDNNPNDIHIYDTTTWELETVIPAERQIRSLSFSPDDKTLATIGPSAAVLWNWRQRKIIHKWPIPSPKAGWDDRVAFFPDGRRLAIIGNSELNIVDVATGDIEHQEPAPDEGTPLAISPDSRYVAMGSGNVNNEIRVLNTASWKQEPPLTGHGDWVTSLTFASNGERLISSSGDNTIRVWDMNSRATTRVLKGHQSEVFTVSLTSDESRAVSGGRDKHILEWDLNAPLPPFREHLLDEKKVEQVVFSADSRSFYTINRNGSISIWDAKTFSKQHSLSQELGENSSIILSADGSHLIAGTGSGELWILDAADLQVVAHRSAQSGQILPVGFSADGKSLVAVEFGNKISQWNVDTWQLRSRVQSRLHIERYIERRFAMPPDSDILLCPSDENIVWWDLAQSQEQARILVNSRRKGGIGVSPTEPLLAVVGASDFIFLWDWQTRQFVDRLHGPRVFNSVAFSPDGRRLVSGSTGKGALMLWDVSTRQEITRFGTSSAVVETVQFSPDGNTICATNNDGIAYFFRAPSFERINAIEAEQHRTERM
ncbi:MAG: protein kinase domain-containing protein [Planctomycetota bacterium]|jgi:serine/threonine protein kinase/WD40 repeat protein